MYQLLVNHTSHETKSDNAKNLCLQITFNNSIKSCLLYKNALFQFKHAQHKLKTMYIFLINKPVLIRS